MPENSEKYPGNHQFFPSLQGGWDPIFTRDEQDPILEMFTTSTRGFILAPLQLHALKKKFD